MVPVDLFIEWKNQFLLIFSVALAFYIVDALKDKRLHFHRIILCKNKNRHNKKKTIKTLE